MKLSNTCYETIFNIFLVSFLLQIAKHTILDHHSMCSYLGIGLIECTLNHPHSLKKRVRDKISCVVVCFPKDCGLLGMISYLKGLEEKYLFYEGSA